MMEIWIRSIARAGGVDMPDTARVLAPHVQRRSPGLRPALARALRSAGVFLLRAGERLCGEAGEADVAIARRSSGRGRFADA